MGFFDGPSAVTFQRAVDGRLLFRPLGRWAATYEVPAERAAALLAWQRRFYMTSFVGMMLLVARWQLRALWAVPIVVGILLLKYWHFTRTLRTTSATPEPVSRADLFVAQARAVGPRWLGVVAVMSVLMGGLGLWMAWSERTRESYLIAGFFGLAALVNAAQWWVARRRQ